MKIIDEYLKSLYKNDKSKEVKELKEELREHLTTSTNEFIDNGYSEEDAQREAINQFDGGTEMLKDLHKSLKESKSTNEKLNKRIINIFKNTAVLSLIVCLIMMVFIGNIREKINYIHDMMGVEVDIITTEKDIHNPKTYEKELKELLNTKEFKLVRNLNIYINPGEKVVYKYSDKINQKEKLVTLGGNGKILNAKGERGGFEVYIDYTPVLTANIIFGCSLCIGIASAIIYIALLIRFKFVFRKKLIYREV